MNDPARWTIVERLLTEHIDGDFLVGCGLSVGNEGGDVAIRDARPSEVAWWAVDAVFEELNLLIPEKEAARMLGLGATTLARWRKEGRPVPPSSRVGKVLLYDRAQVERWRDDNPTAKHQRGRSHGTRNKYREGCRCEPCTLANTAALKRGTDRRKARSARD